MKKTMLLLGVLFCGNAMADVSAFSRANCYVPVADIGWESVTWGWPESKRKTISWHKKDGDPASKAKQYVDDYRVTWRSFAGASHGAVDGWNNNWKVIGKHWWATTVPFNGIYHFKQSEATDCNLNEW